MRKQAPAVGSSARPRGLGTLTGNNLRTRETALGEQSRVGRKPQCALSASSEGMWPKIARSANPGKGTEPEVRVLHGARSRCLYMLRSEPGQAIIRSRRRHSVIRNLHASLLRVLGLLCVMGSACARCVFVLLSGTEKAASSTPHDKGFARWFVAGAPFL